jgi:hypothetical protein
MVAARSGAGAGGLCVGVAVYQLGHDAKRCLARRRGAAGTWSVGRDVVLVGAPLVRGSAVAGAHAWPCGQPHHLRTGRGVPMNTQAPHQRGTLSLTLRSRTGNQRICFGAQKRPCVRHRRPEPRALPFTMVGYPA